MNEIRKQVFLEAPVPRVWEFLTDREKMAGWLMDNDFQRESERFEFTAEPSGAWDGKIYCELREFVEHQRLSYTWTANDVGAETLVTFELAAVDGGTQLTLHHTGFENAMGGARGRHAAGWTRCLKALETSLFGERQDYDWSEFQITYYIEAPLDEVFALWATPRGIGRFWADEVRCVDEHDVARPEDEQFQNGDRVDLLFPTGTRTYLEILNIDANKFVLFSFGEDYGWVSVAFSEADNRTRVDLRQFGLPSGEQATWEVHANARGWWLYNLINAKSVLLHGNDLRVRTPETSGGPTATYPARERQGPHDWAQFDVYLQIDVPPDQVMASWRCASRLEGFFVRQMQVTNETGEARAPEALVEKGDRYAWQFIHDFAGEGEFLLSSPAEAAFTFGKDYRVDVSVAPAGEGTLLHLHQTGMEDTPASRVRGTLNCRCCWIGFMVNLKSVLEFGVDLRDTNPCTADSIAVAFGG